MPCPWCGGGVLVAAFAATTLSAASPAAAQFDADVLQKWMTVTVVHYAVTGEFSASAMVVNEGTNGIAQVGDRVEIGFDYDQTTATLVGEPTIKNFPSTLSPLRNGAEGCTAPTLHGPYEHFTLISLKEGLSGQLEMTAQRDYPAADMPRVCTGGAEAVPARSVTEVESFTVPGVMILAMPLDSTGSLIVSVDRATMMQVNGGWTWTYTPTPSR
jgi:hypothetical protein